MFTYNSSINSWCLKLRKSFVHVDPQCLCQIDAVVIFAICRRESSNSIVRNVAPSPQIGCPIYSLFCRGGPYRLYLILIDFKNIKWIKLSAPLYNPYLLPPLHVSSAPFVVNVEESLARTLGHRVHLAVIKLVPNDSMGFWIQSWKYITSNIQIILFC